MSVLPFEYLLGIAAPQIALPGRAALVRSYLLEFMIFSASWHVTSTPGSIVFRTSFSLWRAVGGRPIHLRWVSLGPRAIQSSGHHHELVACQHGDHRCRRHPRRLSRLDHQRHLAPSR